VLSINKSDINKNISEYISSAKQLLKRFCFTFMANQDQKLQL